MVDFKIAGNRVTMTVDFELTGDVLKRAASSTSMEIDANPKNDNLIEALAATGVITRFLLGRTIAEFTSKSFKSVDDKLGKNVLELNKSVKTKKG
jgi:hypothetical protein